MLSGRGCNQAIQLATSRPNSSLVRINASFGALATTTGQTVPWSIVPRMPTGGLLMPRRLRTLTTSIRILIRVPATSMRRIATTEATAFRSDASPVSFGVLLPIGVSGFSGPQGLRVFISSPSLVFQKLLAQIYD